MGFVRGEQAGDTSELVAAMANQEAAAPGAVGYESASTEPQSESATRSTDPVGYESEDAGPITQLTTRNEAEPVEYDDSVSSQKSSSTAYLYEESSCNTPASLL